MLRIFKVLAFVACLSVFAFNAAPAAAEQSIGVVDVQALLTQSKAGQNIQKQLDTRKEKFLSEIGKEEAALRDEEKKLAGERDSLSKDDFTKKAKAFEEKLNASRQKAQTRKKALEDGANGALIKLRDQIVKIVEEVAASKGYGLVITTQTVVAGGKAFDITEESLKKLNDAVSEIPLDVKE